jgi:hypothetical protein
MIDDFSVGEVTRIASVRNYNVSSGQSGLDGAHVLLGQRTLTLQGDMASGSVEAKITASNGGLLQYTPQSPVFSTDNIFNRDFGGRIILTYLPGDRSTSYDLLSLAPGNAFAIDVLHADFGAAEAFTGQIGMNGRDAVGTFTIRNSTTPYTIVIPYSSLTINPSTTRIRALTFDFMSLGYNGIPAVGEFALDAIRVVPEPNCWSMIWMLAAATSWFGINRRKL